MKSDLVIFRLSTNWNPNTKNNEINTRNDETTDQTNGRELFLGFMIKDGISRDLVPLIPEPGYTPFLI